MINKLDKCPDCGSYIYENCACSAEKEVQKLQQQLLQPPQGITMKQPLKPRSFKLSEDTIHNLRAISHARGNTQSGTLRQLIHHAYEHQILGVPRCASGNPCLVPATWEQHIALRKLAEARAETNAGLPEPQPINPPESATVPHL